jgi:hypothetical protein
MKRFFIIIAVSFLLGISGAGLGSPAYGKVKPGKCIVSIDATIPTNTAAYNNISAGQVGQTFTAEDKTVCDFYQKKIIRLLTSHSISIKIRSMKKRTTGRLNDERNKCPFVW